MLTSNSLLFRFKYSAYSLLYLIKSALMCWQLSTILACSYMASIKCISSWSSARSSASHAPLSCRARLFSYWLAASDSGFSEIFDCEIERRGSASNYACSRGVNTISVSALFRTSLSLAESDVLITGLPLLLTVYLNIEFESCVLLMYEISTCSKVLFSLFSRESVSSSLRSAIWEMCSRCAWLFWSLGLFWFVWPLSLTVASLLVMPYKVSG